MTTAWKALVESRLRSNIEQIGVSATYMSLATVKPDNTPANRTVVFRGFSGQDHREDTGWQSDLLVITTDIRSQKMKHIAHNPIVEVNWFMPGTQEQFRLYGKVHVVGHHISPPEDLNKRVMPTKRVDPLTVKELATKAFLINSKNDSVSFNWQSERLRQWYRMNDDLRATFATDCPLNSLKIKDVDINSGWFIGYDDVQQRLLETGYENFVVLLLDVEKVDHVVLPTGEHSLYHKVRNDNRWSITRLN